MGDFSLFFQTIIMVTHEKLEDAIFHRWPLNHEEIKKKNLSPLGVETAKVGSAGSVAQLAMLLPANSMVTSLILGERRNCFFFFFFIFQ